MSLSLSAKFTAARAIRRLQQASTEKTVAMNRLASGTRTSPGEDAAGVAVASTLQHESRVLAKAIANINDGISYVNLARGALDSLSSVICRQQELATQGATDLLGKQQREALSQEASALQEEFARILSSTKVNGLGVFQSNCLIQAGYWQESGIEINLTSSLGQSVHDGTFRLSTINTIATGNELAVAATDGSSPPDLYSFKVCTARTNTETPLTFLDRRLFE